MRLNSIFFFKQKTAYEMRISDWSSDVCSSDLSAFVHPTAVLIGDVIIGPRAYIAPHVSLRGDFGRIVVGEGANVQDNCVMHSYPSFEAVVEEKDRKSDV